MKDVDIEFTPLDIYSILGENLAKCKGYRDQLEVIMSRNCIKAYTNYLNQHQIKDKLTEKEIHGIATDAAKNISNIFIDIWKKSK